MRFAIFSESTALARAGVASDAGIHPLPPEVTVMVDRLLRERGRYGVGDDRAGVPAAHRKWSGRCTPADIAEVVAFLAGPGRWVNGQVIYANGGVA